MAKAKRKNLQFKTFAAKQRSRGVFVMDGDYVRQEAVHAFKAFVMPLMGVIAAVSRGDHDPDSKPRPQG